jgi:Ca2+-binding RTX toxin-like protein
LAFTTVTGASGAPTTYTGTDGVDLITLVNPGASDLDAQAANDFIGINLTGTTTATSQTLRGGQGNDTFQLTGAANALISSYIAGNLGNDQMFTTGTGVNAQASTVQGGQGNDTINVSATNGGSLINGNLGNDTLNIATGAAGGVISSASLFGGQGNDTINIGGTTTGTVVLAGATIDGALGNDTINLFAFGTGTASGSVSASTIIGGAGEDVIDASNATTTGGAAVALNITGTLSLAGGEDNDIVYGSSRGDSIDGGSGQDFLQGNAGGDTIAGGAGNDVFNIARAVDTLNIQGALANTFVLPTNGGTVNSITVANNTDVITSFTVGDQLVIAASAGAYTTIGAGTGTTLNSVTGTAFSSDNQANVVRGSWNATTNQFVASTTGADTFIGVDINSTATTVNSNGLVIQGVVVNTVGVSVNGAGNAVITYLS